MDSRDNAFEKVYRQSKVEKNPAASVEKGEILFQVKVLEVFGYIDISSTLFTIGGHSVDSNRIARIRYLRSLLHKGITYHLIELCYPTRMKLPADKSSVVNGSRL